MDDKITAIKNFPLPKSVENVRSFIGFCGYYSSFINGSAKLASPLTQLLKNGIPFHWNAPQDRSLSDLKDALINVPALALLDCMLSFEMYTDVSR